MRFFLFYLTMSMAFAFLQDTVLEPFAAQVFGMEAHTTNRFSAYWGSMAILGSFATLLLLRRSDVFSHSSVTQAGVCVLMLAYLLFALSSLAAIRPLVTPGLILLGAGLGVWNIGTLGLMMDLSPAGRAGTFLGFWTFCVTLARGAGVAGGGIVRDLMLALSEFAHRCLRRRILPGFHRAAGLRARSAASQAAETEGDDASDFDVAAALSQSWISAAPPITHDRSRPAKAQVTSSIKRSTSV